ncbi:solute carrier family 2, facilitated glucose transporter member 8 isoform X4 [Cygnus olor]|uniref:solute carrier family 2, facilitated glucose transporter member 8 isoform X4 n=1 Tax=Cygnus olor TaxID=8869 RepID=UPI001ADE2647|nr:solute carrier family 2, facilitated glucose transporter member 8 isoform X4 [Cygnus olor]
MAAEESQYLLGYPASDAYQRVQNKKLYLATFAAVLGPLSFGFVLGYSSPVIPELRKINDPTLRLDSNQASWFGVYISEISHTKVRGMLGSCVQLMVVTGILGAYIAGITLKWHWLAVLCSFPPCIMLLLMSFMPETPRFLLNQNKHAEAIASLQFLRGPYVDHEWECRQIKANVEEEGLNLSEFKNPSIYRPLLIGVALMFLQQVTGINAVMFYAEIIFEDANFKNSRMASVVVGAVQVCFTAVAALIIDKTGRKVLLYISGIIMAVSTALFGLYFKMVLQHGNNSSNADLCFTLNTVSPGTENSLSWLAVVSLGLFVAGFALGWGPVPWLVMSEIFPLKARGISSGVCVLTNWVMAFLVTKEFHDLIALMSYGTFWLFSAFCCLSVTFTAFYVPETKGQTLEQIEAHFRRS